MNWRFFGWLGLGSLAVCAHWFDSDFGRAACAFALLGLIAVGAPHSLRLPLAIITLIAAILTMLGGVPRLLDALPALIASLIAWVFARSLRRGRTPLIARAIVALDGADQLDDPAVARYARGLTRLWTIHQTALATIAAALALRAAGRLDWLPVLAISPRIFGAIILPLAVAALFFGEFALRRWLLPQAPRHSVSAFLRGMLRVWPQLLGD